MARLRMGLVTSKHHQDSELTFSTCLPNYNGDFSRSDKLQVSAITNVPTGKKRNDVCDNISVDTTEGGKSPCCVS